MGHDVAAGAERNRPIDPNDCEECGFDGPGITEMTAEDSIRSLGARYHATLAALGPDRDARLRQRPDPNTWSALEYVAHVRDVIAMWGWILHRTLSEARPELPAADPGLQDRIASESSYNSQDPETVDGELSANAMRMADKVASIDSDHWQRTAQFGDTEVTPLWIVRKVAHEGHHHLMDIERSLSTARGD